MIVDVVNINNKYIHEDKVNTSWRFPVLLLDDNIVYTRFMKALPRKRHIHESFHASSDFFSFPYKFDTKSVTTRRFLFYNYFLCLSKINLINF